MPRSQQPASGRFISIEGGEGAGKSTTIAYLQASLTAAQIPVVVTREPGGTAIGERIRDILLHPQDAAMAHDTELMLMFAARAEHLQKVILPAIGRGEWVICDRFTDATYAYQGAGRGIPEQRIAVLEKWVQGGFEPDMTILFDLPVDLGLQRAGTRGDLDRFEQEQRSFFDAVRECYRERAARYPDRFRIVDASRTLDGDRSQLDLLIAELTGLT